MRVFSTAALAVLCGFAFEAAIGVAHAQSVGQPAAQSASAPTAAAMAAKRPLTHNDFDSWKSIANTTLSRDGKWLAYAIQPQDGDGELVVRETSTGKERREPVGALPPPATTPDPENPDAPPPPRSIRVVFTSDARFLIATTYPTKAEMQAARKARKRPEDMPKGGLIIVDLAASDKPSLRVANVKSIHVPAKGGAWLAYLKEATAEPATPAATSAAGMTTATTAAAKPDAADFTYADDSLDQAAPRRAAAGATATTNSAAPAVTYGTELVLRELATGREQSFANVTEVSFARDGKALLFAVSAKVDAENGVYVVTPSAVTPTSGADAQAAALPQAAALLKGKGKYTKLAWDREQTQVAFFSDRDDAAAKQPQVKVYHWVRGAGGGNTSASEVVINKETGMRDGMPPSDKGTLAFSWDGKKLYVPTASPAKPPRAADAVPEEERVVADLWRWNDDYVQPIQRVRAVQERNRTYRAVFDIASKRLTPIADEAMRTVVMSDDGARAIGLDDRAYRRLTDFDGGYNDVYLVDATSAKSQLVAKKLRSAGGAPGGMGAFQWSPDGKWVLFYREQHWHVLSTADGKTRNLTAGVAAKAKRVFFNEEQDTPGPKGSYGTAGWLSDSSSALVYDRFDVWQVFADGRAPRNLTNDAGRKENVRLRVQPLEPVDEDDDERGINPSKPLVLRGESEVTRASGFYRTAFAAGAKLERLIWGDASHRVVTRAREADSVVMTASRFDRYPDLQLTNTSFASPRAVSKVGAQVEPFLWGSGELMSFTSAAGKPLSAAVYKPANFDPKKKYPLMVYIYEKLSQNVHNFVDPRPSNGINASLYTSNGYVVLMPDIVYGAKGFGKPGQDAMGAVMPAIDKIVKQGFINEKAMGIQGHSWGGYQIAWMVTRTNRFRAAEAGAPVGNMTSAYSGIRWGSGLPRQFQYEQGQSRIAKSMADDPKSYIEASPVFAAHKVTTPLLILHNDADDAVPWYQGIELFLAMRRYNKEAYLFNYNNQLHNLRRRADQKDFALRMHQFFDHFLKGAPAPDWMTKGINFLDRDEEKDVFRKARESTK
jgi:dipeptidyl aminopeptidase/acylaminoacyl peptidase